MEITIRFAEEKDVSKILYFIKELAIYEHMEDEVVATNELLTKGMQERGFNFKNPLDLLYLFWSVSAGIICGVNLKVLALLICVIMTVVILLLQMLPVMQAPLVLVVRGDAKETD